MANKLAKREMLIEKRARALTVMYLTGRSDLIVEEAGRNAGFDLVVRFVPRNKEGIRQFGVAHRGAWPSVAGEEADKLLGPSIRETRNCGPFAFPVCLFFFTMEEDQAWYAWVAEPIVETGKAVLRMHKEADCKPLGKKAINEIVEHVDRWYDAFFENLVAVAASGGKSVLDGRA